MNDAQVKDLANFMGHSKTIHEDYYRLPIAARKITTISKLLEMAQGEEPGDNFQQNFNSTNSSVEDEDDTQSPVHRRSSKFIIFDIYAGIIFNKVEYLVSGTYMISNVISLF